MGAGAFILLCGSGDQFPAGPSHIPLKGGGGPHVAHAILRLSVSLKMTLNF